MSAETMRQSAAEENQLSKHGAQMTALDRIEERLKEIDRKLSYLAMHILTAAKQDKGGE